MPIYTLQELRQTAPEKMRNMSDGALLCEYARQKNLSVNEVADYLGAIEFAPLDCGRELHWEDIKNYKLPISGGEWGLFVAIGFSLIWYFAKRIGRNVEATNHRRLIYLSLIYSVAFGLGLGIVSAINKPIYMVFSITVASSVLLFLFFFACGYLSVAIKNGNVNQAVGVFVSHIRLRAFGRKDKAIWKKIAAEMDSNFVDQALWMRSLSLANGHEDAAKAIYIKLRFDEIALNQTENQPYSKS
jgi:hypothetical protein